MNEKILEFTIFCVESLAEELKINAKQANKILLQSLYKNIILEFSKETDKNLQDSMDLFYNSDTYELISEGVGDLHCRSVKYLAQELMLEYGMMNHKGYPKDFVH